MEPDSIIQGFASIRGHAGVVERLGRSITAGRVHHAYYFTGPDGVGKASTAVALAQAMSCDRAPGEGCGECPTCSRMARNIHPDLVWVEAEGKQIKIQQIRQLEDRLAQGAHEAHALVILVNEVERLNVHAANALLKSLEEPRSGVHFVLVSAASHRVPITVRSRCQQVRFGPLSKEVLTELMAERVSLEADQAAEAARLADGSLSRALMLVDNEDFPVWQSWVVRLAAGSCPGRTCPVRCRRCSERWRIPCRCWGCFGCGCGITCCLQRTSPRAGSYRWSPTRPRPSGRASGPWWRPSAGWPPWRRACAI